MKAALCLEQHEPLTVEEVTPIDPGPSDAIVRVTASGVCHSDLANIDGTLPAQRLVLGHEGTGIVEKVGADVRGLSVGDRVIGSFVPACGECWYCRNDQSNLCAQALPGMFVKRVRRADGEELHAMTGLGTFAELITASQHSLVKVESDLPDEQLALIGCGVTTGVCAVINTARVEPGSTVAVIGCGGVGQAVVQGARIAGAARIIAVDPVAMKRESALQLGATDTVDPSDANPKEALRALTDGRGADYVFEVIGNLATMRQAVECTRAGGTTVLIGMPALKADVPIPAAIVLMQKSVLGCVYGGAQVRRDFPRLIRFVEQGMLDVGSMVSRTLPLDDVNDAIAAMQNGEVIRSVIV
jgi:S-(hydroxymethyl)glutathione dehydrogenase / alcohol dehydrogenase